MMWWLKWETFQHQMTNRALPYISWCSAHSKDGKRYMIRISAHYLLSKHNNTPKALRCLVLFTDNCEAILQSDVLKDVGHLRRWHCQHCHVWQCWQSPNGKCPALSSGLSYCLYCWHAETTVPEEETERHLTPGENWGNNSHFTQTFSRTQPSD